MLSRPTEAPGPLTPILLIAYHFPPDSATGSARPYRFYKYIGEYGYLPYVLAAGDPLPEGVEPYVTRVRDTAYIPSKRTFLGAAEILLRKTLFPQHLWMTWTWPAVQAAQRVIREAKIQAILSTYPHANTLFAGAWLKRKFRLPWVADFRDPLVAADPSKPVQPGFQNALQRWMQREFIDRADAVIANTDAVVQAWSKLYPEYASKTHLIWNGFDPEEPIRPLQPAARGWRLLLHIGSLYFGRDPGLILRAIKHLLETGRLPKRSLRVGLVGFIDGAIETANAELLEKLSAAGVLEARGNVPRKQALQLMGEADYLLLIDLYPKGEGGFLVPAKLYEYMRTGRPILAFTTADSVVERILQRSDARYVVIRQNDTLEQACSSILRLLAMSPEPRLPNEWFFNEFDGRRQVQKLAAILDGLRKRPLAL